jgi:hypothetical protein
MSAAPSLPPAGYRPYAVAVDGRHDCIINAVSAWAALGLFLDEEYGAFVEVRADRVRVDDDEFIRAAVKMAGTPIVTVQPADAEHVALHTAALAASLAG